MTTTLIRDRQKAAQIVDFSGLRWGPCFPTDVDALLEFGGQVWVIIEAKYQRASMPEGQQKALERLTDHLGRLAFAICLLATHDSSGDIPLGECEVFGFRRRGKWHEPKRAATVKEVVEGYLRTVAPDELLERLSLKPFASRMSEPQYSPDTPRRTSTRAPPG